MPASSASDVPRVIPYAAVEHHGVVGNGRTAALVSADGSIDWLCAPDFDGPIVFGALLDARAGGHWRIGPLRLVTGEQAYRGSAPILSTRWSDANVELSVTDALAPGPLIVRRVECHRGSAECASSFSAPASGLQDRSAAVDSWLPWCSHSSFINGKGAARLSAGDVVWFAFGDAAETPNAALLSRMFEDIRGAWMARIPAGTRNDPALIRAAMVVHLLQYEPTGAVVAAPTTSVPERIGGGWNVDYRLSWVRDSALALAMLARLGDVAPAQRYLEWLATVGSDLDAPLQTLYTIRGDRHPAQRDLKGLRGYRESQPVRIGNNAFRQRQADVFGFLADCALDVVDHGGTCSRAVWDLLSRSADYVAATWCQEDHSMWELSKAAHYTSSHVMCWVALDRTLAVGRRLGMPDRDDWARAAKAIRSDVLTRGWNAARGAFTQMPGSEALDASALLIPLYGLLPVDDARVVSTVERIADELTIDGFLYRFDPSPLGGVMGEFEAAFIPCTFWLAAVYRLLNRDGDAAAVLSAVDSIGGEARLLAEAVDPRTRSFAGNFPLAFSHAERIRAALA